MPKALEKILGLPRGKFLLPDASVLKMLRILWRNQKRVTSTKQDFGAPNTAGGHAPISVLEVMPGTARRSIAGVWAVARWDPQKHAARALARKQCVGPVLCDPPPPLPNIGCLLAFGTAQEPHADGVSNRIVGVLRRAIVYCDYLTCYDSLVAP